MSFDAKKIKLTCICAIVQKKIESQYLKMGFPLGIFLYQYLDEYNFINHSFINFVFLFLIIARLSKNALIVVDS